MHAHAVYVRSTLVALHTVVNMLSVVRMAEIAEVVKCEFKTIIQPLLTGRTVTHGRLLLCCLGNHIICVTYIQLHLLLDNSCCGCTCMASIATVDEHSLTITFTDNGFEETPITAAIVGARGCSPFMYHPN